MSVYTSTQLTTDHGSRFLAKPTRIVLHHGATTSLAGLIRLMMAGGRTVSAHAAIGGKHIVNVVPESRRSFSLASAIFERGVLSAECVNSTLGPHWRLSDDTHESIAQWVADVCRRHNIKPHRDGKPSSWTVIGHNEVYTIHKRSYATACPGGMNIGWIVRRAQHLLAEPEVQPQPETAIYEEDNDMRVICGKLDATKPRFAFIAPWLPNGAHLTDDPTEAGALSALYDRNWTVVGSQPPYDFVTRSAAKFDRIVEIAAEHAAAWRASFPASVGAAVGATPPTAPAQPFPTLEGTLTLTPKE